MIDLSQEVERLRRERDEARMENERLRKTLRRVVREARRQYHVQITRKEQIQDDIKRSGEFSEKIREMLSHSAAGPWHPISETPPIGPKLVLCDGVVAGADWGGEGWDWGTPEAVYITHWADVRLPEETT